MELEAILQLFMKMIAWMARSPRVRVLMVLRVVVVVVVAESRVEGPGGGARILRRG